MSRESAFIDSNLLVLPLVGRVDCDLIVRHKRTRSFDPEDYNHLIAKNEAIDRLGLTDVVLLESISAKLPLITVDFDLYGDALAKGDKFTFNFRHRQAW